MIRTRTLIWLFAAALFVRALVPAGWMPGASEGRLVTLCTGQGMVSGWVDADGKLHKGKPSNGDPSSKPCAFAGLAMAADLAEPAHDASALQPEPALRLARPQFVAIGQGLPAPPPPQTGPPILK